MANDQQPLNGAYYGPAIPPSGQPRQSHHRGRSCFCCLFGVFWKILITLIVLVGLVILIFYLIVQPRPFKFYVNEAKLTEFNYTLRRNYRLACSGLCLGSSKKKIFSLDQRVNLRFKNLPRLPKVSGSATDYTNNTLRYNMVLNFTARNPNKKLNIYYDKVEALAFYEDSRFASDDKVITHMNSFRQYKKSSSPMSATFSGQHVMVLDSDQLSELSKDKSAHVYDIYVKLHFRIRFRLGDFIFNNDLKPKVKCDLKVPLDSNATFTFFAVTKCDVDFWN